MPDIYKSAGIIIRDRKLLVTRTKGKDAFVSPGGKMEPGETAEQTLLRELREEVGIEVTEGDITHFGSYTADATYNPGSTTHMEAFIVNTWQGNIMPSSEIEEVKWVDSNDLGKIKLGSIFEHEVMPRLKEQGLID